MENVSYFLFIFALETETKQEHRDRFRKLFLEEWLGGHIAKLVSVWVKLWKIICNYL